MAEPHPNDTPGDTRSGATPSGERRTVRPRLYRSRSDRMVGGVCGGLGEHFDVDPVWFRIGFVVLAVSGGSGLLAYLIMWLVVPQAPPAHVAEPGAGAALPVPAAIGVVLMAVGGIALLNAIAPSLGRFFWPVTLLVVGLALVIGGLDRDRRR